MIFTIILSIFPILLVVSIFAIGFSWYIAHSSMMPAKTPKTETPAHQGLSYEDFVLKNSDVTLRGWFIPAAGTDTGPTRAPAIIVSHGWGRSAQQMLPHASYLHEAGFHVVLYDMRGHGDSDAVPFVTLKHLVKDLVAVLDYILTRPDVDNEAIGLFGHSMGAAVSLLKASTDSRIKAVVSSSGFADLYDLTTQMLHMRKLPAFPFRWLILKFWQKYTGLSIEEVNPVARIRQIHAPVLLLHGEQDQVITPDQLDKLFQNANQAEKHLVSGKTHSDLFEDENYRARVISFFKTYLGCS
ncbi:MAG: alpha/beta fold hydrolase [Calditrichaeota bacterium]|nr:MAG: alpha/beta fold hydrolase [Calditrichota bacterium]